MGITTYSYGYHLIHLLFRILSQTGRLNVNKFVSNIKEIEKTNMDDSHVFIKLTDKKGNKMEMQICKS